MQLQTPFYAIYANKHGLHNELNAGIRSIHSHLDKKLKESRFITIHGDPVIPTSESLAIIELSSHSSGEGKSDSGNQGLEKNMNI